LVLQLPTNDQLQTEIADRITAQSALEIANARFRALFNNMPDGVAVYEAINEGQDFVFQDFNRAGELLDHIKRDDLLNRPVTQVFPDVEDFGLLSVLRRVWQTGQAEQLPISLYKDGRLEVYRQNYVYRLPSGEVVAIYEDVSEQKKAEQAQQEALERLQKSEAHYRDTFEYAPIGVVNVALDGRFIAVNQTYCDFVGYSREELLNMTVTQLSLEHEKSAYRLIMQQLLTGKKTNFCIEKQYPCKDGSIVWGSLSVQLNRHSDGSPDCFIATVENIEERKQIEQQLKESEAQFRAIIQVSPIPLALNDSQQNITLLNNAFTQTFGYDINDIPTLSHWWLKAYPDPVYRRWVYDTWQQSLKRAETEHALFTPLELTICCKNGTFKTVLINAAVILDSFESLHLVMLYDITERKQAEVELRIAATVFESQEGMLITDINGVIVKVNHAFTLITGYSVQEVIGKQTSFLHSGQHDQAFYDAMWQSIHDSGTWQGEIWNRRKNGEIYPEWLTITAVKANNDNTITITHYVATLTDITERKAAEETIKQLAFYDPLTNLPNRRLLYERLKHGIEVSCRTDKLIAVLMMDLDK
jgi:PAS domain S-box-containing protein